jgi:hypothetical protein
MLRATREMLLTSPHEKELKKLVKSLACAGVGEPCVLCFYTNRLSLLNTFSNETDVFLIFFLALSK